MAIVVEVEDIRARYHGGEYIDLCFGDRAFEVINVWDYETGKSRCARSAGAVRVEVRRWLRENRQYLADYRMSVGL